MEASWSKSGGFHSGEAKNPILLSSQAWVSQQSQDGAKDLEESWKIIGLQPTLDDQSSWVLISMKSR